MCPPSTSTTHCAMHAAFFGCPFKAKCSCALDNTTEVSILLIMEILCNLVNVPETCEVCDSKFGRNHR